MRGVRKDLDAFVTYFKMYLHDIESLCLPSYASTLTYKKVLYVSVLDALSASVFPREKSNRERFIKLISKFCDWPESENISFPHLQRLVQLLPEPRYAKLHEYVKSKRFDPCSHITEDPNFKDIDMQCKLSNIGIDEKLFERVSIRDLMHSSLFWQLRNGLIHEFRKRGHGLEDAESSDPMVYPNGVVMPHYHSVDERGDFELVYPLGFFKRISESALKNVESHFKKIAHNPYDSFKFGPYYLQDLN